MLCDFKNNEVRKNFDEILSIQNTNGTQNEKVKEQETVKKQEASIVAPKTV